jgi:hypothetical protein
MGMMVQRVVVGKGESTRGQAFFRVMQTRVWAFSINRAGSKSAASTLVHLGGHTPCTEPPVALTASPPGGRPRPGAAAEEVAAAGEVAAAAAAKAFRQDWAPPPRRLAAGAAAVGAAAAAAKCRQWVRM